MTRVALVTGAGRRRIGAAVADALAASGWSLAIHYRTAAAEADEAVARYRAQGVEAVAIGADLRAEGEVRTLVEQTLARFGHIDLLAHCAATWPRKPLEATTADDVSDAFASNTLATFLVAREAGLAMTRQPTGGSIVLLGDWATRRPYLGYAAYFASKGAIATLTRTLAVELGTRNPAVRVNCVQPGPVMLPPDLPEAERREAIAATLVKREGRPENVAQAVLFFADNDFVTGACLPVDGGRSVYAPDA